MMTSRRDWKPRPRLYGVGTALPPHQAGQATVKRFMASLAEATLQGRRRAGRAPDG